MLYKKIDKSSVNTVSSALNLFSLPPTNVSVQNAVYKEILTLNPLTSKPFNFKIFSSSSYIDLSKCYLYVKIKIQKGANAQAWEDQDNVSTINLIGSTWIKNLRISVNNQEVEQSNGLYAYRAFLDSYLTYSNEVKNSYLTCAGYYEDSLNNIEHFHNGTGYKERQKLFKNGQTVEFITRINSDLFCQEKFLLNHCELSLEVTPNDDAFMLWRPDQNPAIPGGAAARAAPDYRIVFEDVRLFVKCIDLHDSLSLEINKQLDSEPAQYSIRKTQLVHRFIEPGRSEYQANLFTDVLPRRIILALVDHSAFTGDKTKNPFNFKHFNVREISLHANGRQYPNILYDNNYENGQCIRPLYESFEALGLSGSLDSNGISREKFLKGSAIYILNMTNSLENDNHFELIKQGTTMVNIKFHEEVPVDGITLIAYMEFDGILMIDRNRTLASDNSV